MPTRFDPQAVDADPNLNDDMLRIRVASGQGTQQFVPAVRRAFSIAEILAGTFDIGKLPIPVPAVLSGIVFLVLWGVINKMTYWGIIGYGQLGNVVGYLFLIVGAGGLFLLARLTDPDPKSKPSMGQMLGVFAVFLPAVLNPFGGDTGAWIIWTVGVTAIVVAIHFVWVRVASGDLNSSIIYVIVLVGFILGIWAFSGVIAFAANTAGTGQLMGPVNITDHNNRQYELDKQRPGYTPAAPAPLLNGDPFKIAPTLVPGAPTPEIAPSPTPVPIPDCVKLHGKGWYWDARAASRGGDGCVH